MDTKVYLAVWWGPTESNPVRAHLAHIEETNLSSYRLGLSSGGVSAALHTVYNNGFNQGLFRALWAESGAVQPLGMIDAPQQQATYDMYIASLNCSNAQDTLACIRQAPLEAVTNISAALTVWSPLVDGVTISDFPQKMIVNGRHARIPVVAGTLPSPSPGRHCVHHV